MQRLLSLEEVKNDHEAIPTSCFAPASLSGWCSLEISCGKKMSSASSDDVPASLLDSLFAVVRVSTDRVDPGTLQTYPSLSL